MKANLLQILNRFDSISLIEMGSAELMVRSDLKFAITLEDLFFILPCLSNDYRILQIDNKRLFEYDTLYYDTPDHLLYRMHHNGKMNRYKVRRRTYVDSNLSFLEAKIKNNKGVTNKVRVKCEKDVDFNDELISVFLEDQLQADCRNLIPSLNINYYRIALVNKNEVERVTIDLELSYHINDKNATYKNLVIIEVKSEGKLPTLIKKLMRDNNFKPVSLSKYCVGMYMLEVNEKRNNFKPQVIQLNKIIAN
ncbi:MAG: polyphosphate polymerase domain-containing protein [Bacteroidota bacterium]